MDNVTIGKQTFAFLRRCEREFRAWALTQRKADRGSQDTVRVEITWNDGDEPTVTLNPSPEVHASRTASYAPPR
jgi:hypothetical protein